MLIKRIHISNFRNIEQADVTFGSGLNIIHGANGQGKTNLLEAVYLLALADSYRTNNDAELVKFGEDKAFLRAELQNNNQSAVQSSELALEITKTSTSKAKKTFSQDNLPLAKVADFIGTFNAVLFAPEDLLLIKAGPKQRRQFMNRILAQAKKTYIFNLQQLNQILLTKNHLLKDLQNFDKQSAIEIYKEMLETESNKSDTDINYLKNLLADFKENNEKQIIKQKIALLIELNKKFVEQASTIIYERLQLIMAFNNLVQNYQNSLSLGQERLSVRYLSCVNLTADTNLTEIAEQLTTKIKQTFISDIYKAYTSVGPQRDDLEFYLNDKNCRMYASQGQQRTVILNLKLAECDYLTNIKHIKPVLLLDDVLSELDSKRQAALLTNIMDRQVLLTCTETDFINRENLRAEKIVYLSVNQGTINKD